MIITDHFVFLHLPKTGGTFVSESLHRAFKTRRTWLNSLTSLFRFGHRFQTIHGSFVHAHQWHGTRQEIPQDVRTLPILTCLRHPLARYVSIYEFGWWKRPEFRKGFQQGTSNFGQRYSDFPNLNFRDFLNLLHETRMPKGWREFSNPNSPGLHTWQSIRQLTLNPNAWSQQPHCDPNELQQELRDIHFLRTSSLNRDLYHYLLSCKLPEEDLNFILTKKRVLPHGKGQPLTASWESYYDEDLRRLMESKDRFWIDLYDSDK